MRLSCFNVINKGKDYTFIYNTLTHGFIKVPNTRWDHIEKRDADIEHELKKVLYANGILIDDDYNEVDIYKYHYYDSAFRNQIPFVYIAPTMDCNFGCRYCFESGNRKNGVMPEKIQNNLIRFLKSIAKENKINIIWFGGEPLMGYETILQLCELLSMNGIGYTSSIITNGSLLTQEKLVHIEKLKLDFIQVSMDGDKKDQDRRRRFKNGNPSFDIIMDNIGHCLDNTSIPICIQVTVDRENPSAWRELSEYCLKRFGEEMQNHRLRIGYNFVKDRTGFDKKGVCFSNEDILSYQQSELEREQIHSKIELPGIQMPCMYRTRNMFAIDPRGYVYKCLEDLGNPLQAIGSVDNMKFSRNKLVKCMIGNDPFDDELCRTCNVLPICGGGCPKKRIKIEDGNLLRQCCYHKSNLSAMLPSIYEAKYK